MGAEVEFVLVQELRRVFVAGCLAETVRLRNFFRLKQ
jgi:hypothetical protein